MVQGLRFENKITCLTQVLHTNPPCQWILHLVELIRTIVAFNDTIKIPVKTKLPQKRIKYSRDILKSIVHHILWLLLSYEENTKVNIYIYIYTHLRIVALKVKVQTFVLTHNQHIYTYFLHIKYGWSCVFLSNEKRNSILYYLEMKELLLLTWTFASWYNILYHKLCSIVGWDAKFEQFHRSTNTEIWVVGVTN